MDQVCPCKLVLGERGLHCTGSGETLLKQRPPPGMSKECHRSTSAVLLIIIRIVYSPSAFVAAPEWPYSDYTYLHWTQRALPFASYFPYHLSSYCQLPASHTCPRLFHCITFCPSLSIILFSSPPSGYLDPFVSHLCVYPAL